MFCPFNRLIIKQAATESKTPGGIIIPEKAKGKIAPRRGEVLEAGPECKYVRKGDEVVFDREAVFYDGIPDADGTMVEYVFAKEQDIFAVGNRDLEVDIKGFRTSPCGAINTIHTARSISGETPAPLSEADDQTLDTNDPRN